MILAVSAPHQRFAIPELERLDEAVPGLRAGLAVESGVKGFVVLATCHRIEAYVDTDDPERAELLARSALAAAGVSGLRERLLVATDAGAAQHLFEVASGLQSMVLGENEIAGQVRGALGRARDEGHTTPGLYRLFQLAMRTAKAVAGTDLGSQGRSLVGAALAGERIESALIIGTGAFARVARAQLSRLGCGRVAVFSPSGRAEAFAASHDAVALSAQALQEELAGTDIVLGCSGQGEYSLTVEMVTEALSRRNSPLQIVDFALRRDIDPAVGRLTGVRLRDLGDISAGADVDTGSARRLVAEGVADYLDAERERAALSAVRRVREHVESVAAAELARAQRRMTDLSPAQAEQVKLLVHRICQGVLHLPSVRASELARQGLADDYEAAVSLLLGEVST